ncbi:MAG: single-stranded-DNA-specific exonuclease [Candidatus Methanomethylophilaceae archaeon]|nr:single-stranded-DNA-specific exonuclease [Candidatus Methanomethylophilaceae archaeon]
MDRSVPNKLLDDLSKAAEIVRGHGFIHVFSHYDADGIASAGIIAKTLLREGKEFTATLFTTLDDTSFDHIRNCGAECVIISDLGASYIEELDAMTCDVVVLDHHAVCAEAARICYINPHLHGIDGMKFGCGSTMACLFAIRMDHRNWDLVQIAFAGMYGDRQEMEGLNGFLLDGAVKRGFIKAESGYVVPRGKLTDELYLMTEPYIRGVSGSAEGVASLLKDAGISRDAMGSGLSDSERRRLSSLMVLKLAEQGVAAETMESTSGTRYALKDWSLDSAGLASLFDGCGRNGQMGLGVAVACGDVKSIEAAAEIEKEYRREVVQSAAALDERGLTQMSNVQWFDGTRSGYTGVLCGIAMSYFGDQSKPTFGINSSEEMAKVSGRATGKLLARGVDLSSALREACSSVGGTGGGHRIASGGSFPSGRTRDFIEKLNGIIKSQVSAR